MKHTALIENKSAEQFYHLLKKFELEASDVFENDFRTKFIFENVTEKTIEIIEALEESL